MSLALLLPAAVLACALYAFARVVRALARRIEAPFMPWTELIEFEPVLGWKPRARLNGHYLALNDDVFRVMTDAEGWPGGRLDDSEVVVVGDSFAFGYGVDTDRSFAALNRRLRVKACGAPGYSMVHGVRLMERLGDRLRGKLVVWFAFLENDLQDNLAPEMGGYRAPFVRSVGSTWEIVDQHLSAGRWRLSSLDTRRLFPAFCVPGPMADRAYSACGYLIGRAAATCRAHQATLVVVTVPHPMQLTPPGLAALAAASGNPALCDPDLPDRRVAESCSRHQVAFVAGKEFLTARHYKDREGIHWNARGHRRMARLLETLHASFAPGGRQEPLPREDAFAGRIASDARAAAAPVARPAAGPGVASG